MGRRYEREHRRRRDARPRGGATHGKDRRDRHVGRRLAGARRSSRQGDGGQVLPLLGLVVAVAGLGILGLGRLTVGATDQAAAARAADAAALAGVRPGSEGGQSMAERVARANGARLVDYRRIGAADARVVVEYEGFRVSARARSAPRSARSSPSAVPGGGARNGLAPAMLAALHRADAVLGRPVPVTSGRRTRAEQQRLYDQRSTNAFPVAKPGSSRHESGLAIDVPLAIAERLARVSDRTGLCRPVPDDPVHFELCR